jgi:uncharacterized protein YbjT (DUF2867 family)
VDLLVTGATGYVGSQLVPELLERGHRVRALSRNPGRLPAAVDARRGDAVSGEGLAEALDGCRAAYCLIHSMDSDGDFAARDREAAVNFGEAARAAGVERVISRTQPVAVGDVVRALADVADADEVPPEVQLGGADVLTHREMMERTAAVLGRRRPLVVKVPVLTPRLSSYWVMLVTPVETGLVRPLVDGLVSEMLVREAPPPGVNDDPLGFDDAVRAAVA